PAMITAVSGTYPLPRLFSATCTVGFDEFKVMTGQKKSFQAVMKVSMPSTAIPGRAIGSTIVQKVRSAEAPSTLAASISSSGRDCATYCRMKNTPNAVTSVGRMTEASVPVRLYSDMSVNSGTTPRVGGIIIVPIVNTNNALRPRKRSFANAYPAAVQNSNVPAVIADETISEFRIARPMLCWSSAFWMFDHRSGPGVSGG